MLYQIGKHVFFQIFLFLFIRSIDHANCIFPISEFVCIAVPVDSKSLCYIFGPGFTKFVGYANVLLMFLSIQQKEYVSVVSFRDSIFNLQNVSQSAIPIGLVHDT